MQFSRALIALLPFTAAGSGTFIFFGLHIQVTLYFHLSKLATTRDEQEKTRNGCKSAASAAAL